MNSTFCAFCKHYQALPAREEKMHYPWGGYDIFYIEEGMCEYHKIKVVAQQEMYCKHFNLKEEYAKRRNKNGRSNIIQSTTIS